MSFTKPDYTVQCYWILVSWKIFSLSGINNVSGCRITKFYITVNFILHFSSNHFSICVTISNYNHTLRNWGIKDLSNSILCNTTCLNAINELVLEDFITQN